MKYFKMAAVLALYGGALLVLQTTRAPAVVAGPAKPSSTKQAAKIAEIDGKFDALEAVERRAAWDAFSRPFKFGISIFGTAAAILSGGLWYASAVAALDATTKAAQAAINQQVVADLLLASAHENKWAAALSALAGLAFGVVLLWDNWRTPKV